MHSGNNTYANNVTRTNVSIKYTKRSMAICIFKNLCWNQGPDKMKFSMLSNAGKIKLYCTVFPTGIYVNTCWSITYFSETGVISGKCKGKICFMNKIHLQK